MLTIPEDEQLYPSFIYGDIEVEELKSLSPKLELVKLLTQSVI